MQTTKTFNLQCWPVQSFQVIFNSRYKWTDLCIHPMDLKVVPLHKHPEFLKQSCLLVNEEWKRSETARLRSLESSCDTLPTCLILLKDGRVIGHSKLSRIPSIADGCFVESVVIAKELRGSGYGRHLMQEIEKYCSRVLNINSIYLSTKGQEIFYSKLGYEQCQVISIYGSSCIKNTNNLSNAESVRLGPVPPPMPPSHNTTPVQKTYMKKVLAAHSSCTKNHEFHTK